MIQHLSAELEGIVAPFDMPFEVWQPNLALGALVWPWSCTNEASIAASHLRSIKFDFVSVEAASCYSGVGSVGQPAA